MADRTVFVAWDSTLKHVAKTMRIIGAGPDPAHPIRILGAPGDVPRGDLAKILQAAMANAGAFLAVVDEPNANVMWELGMALGAGLPVALATECAEPARRPDGKHWDDGTPISHLLRMPNAGTGREARKLLATAGTWPVPTVAQRKPSRRVVVCAPAGIGDEWARVLKAEQHELLSLERWSPLDLPKQLADVARLAWVVVPRERVDHRHGACNATPAMIAGCAEQLGIEVALFVEPDSPNIADGKHLARPFDGTETDLHTQINAWHAELDQAPQHVGPALKRYLGAVGKRHDRPLAYLTHLGLAEADLQPVELDVIRSDRAMRMDGLGHAGLRDAEKRPLCAWLEDPETGSRWVIKAEPGAGKTTSLRQLASALAREDGPIPVFVSLAAWEQDDRRSLLGFAAHRAGVDLRVLQTAAAQRGMWWFLDGYDEVKAPSEIRRRVQEAIDASPGPEVVVLSSRPAQIRPADWKGWTLSTVSPLSDDDQRTLVQGLLRGEADEAAAFRTAMEAVPRVLPLLANPFLVTLAAAMWQQSREDQRPPPSNERELLDRAIADCLTRGWGEQRERPPRYDPGQARIVLRALSVELHELGGEAWTLDQVSTAMSACVGRFPFIKSIVGIQGNIWRTYQDFLDDVAHYAGVFGPLDDGEASWRYLHRTFRERLVVEAVAPRSRLMDGDARRCMVEGIIDAVESAGRKDEGRQRSIDIAAMMAGECGGSEGARYLERLAPFAPTRAVRELLELKGLDPVQRLLSLVAMPVTLDGDWQGWDGDHLDRVVDLCPSVQPLWGVVAPGTDRQMQGALWYAIERLSEPADGWTEDEHRACWARFESAAGLPKNRPDLTLVDVPVNAAFRMGDRHEKPVRQVRLTHPHGLSATPVTQGQYAAFSGRPPADGADHPAVGVTWLEARLFAAWLGGRLPTDAEWEHACRAGTATAYSFGDDEGLLNQHGWYAGNSAMHLHPVGKKAANPWGLHDMHGLVWEWCEDRSGAYDPEETADPRGPRRGPSRVLRGGSFLDPAEDCRSARRSWVLPGLRNRNIGFRVLVPAAAHLGHGS